MRKYLIISLIFISLVVLAIYTQDNANLNFFGIVLPVSLWAGIVLVIFWLFSIGYFSIVSFKNFFYQKRIQKDLRALIENIKNKILFKNLFKDTKELKDLNEFVKLIDGLKITPKKIKNFEFLEDLEKLEKGEVVELKKYKLDDKNPWVIKNYENKLNKDQKFAREPIKKDGPNYLKNKAKKIYATIAPVYEILNLDIEIDFEILKARIEDKEFKKLLDKAKLAPIEEIEIAKMIKNNNPDEEIKLFENKPWGQAYLALKYNHLDLAKEIIAANNLKFFEYFLKVKETSQADIDEYIASRI